MKTGQNSLLKVKKALLDSLAAGGKEIMKGHAKKRTISYKTPISLVTETDTASEKAILRILHRHFPKHTVLAEESGLNDLKSEHKWIIDPVDGTTNFANNIPHASVSIAYERDGQILLGGVLNPFSQELFFAQKNKGAFLNGKRIQVTKTKTMKQALLATGFPYDRVKNAKYYLHLIEPFLKKSQGIRRFGSSALDLCWVACGRYDAYWEANLAPWDVAAGALIVEEARGVMCDFEGKEFSVYGREVVASNPLIVKAMLRELQKAKKEFRK
jgi:myo-inositol-1(or 4)-monophosphatase